MLFRSLLEIATFGVAVLAIGWLLEPLWLRRAPFPSPAAPLAAGSALTCMLVGGGVWLGISNEVLGGCMWALAVAGLALRFGRAGPWRGWAFDRGALLDVATFAAFWIFCFTLIATPDPGQLEPALHAARSGGLSSDCWLSHRFAEMVVQRLDPNEVEFAGNWRITDRGPLYGLLTAAERMMFGPRGYADYVALGSALNALVLPVGLFLLRGLGASGRARGFFVAMLVFSVWTTLNVWFTWPKLFGTALLFLAVEAIWKQRPVVWAAVFTGLAMHAHGIAIFTLPALLAMLWLRDRPSRVRSVAVFAVTLAAVLLPWEAYKRGWHPDTKRLMKMHFFDEPNPTPETLLHTGRRYFATHPPRELAAIHAGNLVYPVHPGHAVNAVSAGARGAWGEALDQLWLFSFRQLVGALNPIMFVALVIAAVRTRKTWAQQRFAAASLCAIAVVAFVIPVMLFGARDGTTNHQWVYSTLMALQLLGVIALDRAFGRRAWWLFVPLAAWEGAVLYKHFWISAIPLAEIPGVPAAVHVVALAALLALLRATARAPAATG